MSGEAEGLILKALGDGRELSEEGVDLDVISQFDLILSEAVLEEKSPLVYLAKVMDALECYSMSQTDKEPFEKALDIVRRWVHTTVTTPGLWEDTDGLVEGENGGMFLIPMLHPIHPKLLDTLQAIVSHSDEKERVLIFTPVYEYIMRQARQPGASGTALQATAFLTSLPDLATALVDSSVWLPSGSPVTGRQIEHGTLLGAHFAGGEDVGLDNHHQQLHSMLKKNFLTPKPEEWPALRSGVLDFFSAMLNANTDLRKEYASDSCSTVSIYNLCNVLHLSLDPVYARPALFDKIDPLYTIYPSSRLRFADESRMGCESKEARAIGEQREAVKPPVNFSCEVYFMCLYATFLATEHLIKQQSRGDPLAWLGMGGHDKAKALLLSNDFLSRAFRITEFTSFWLLCMASRTPPQSVENWLNSSFPPLPSTPPEEWRVLPEYFITSLSRFVTFLCEPFPSSLANFVPRNLMTLCATLMGSREYIHNPHTRSNLCATLAKLVAADGKLHGAFGHHTKTPFVSLLNPTLFLRNLPAAFVAVESLGDSRFTTRCHLAQVDEAVQEVHRVGYEAVREADRIVVLKYLNMLLGDTLALFTSITQRIAALRQGVVNVMHDPNHINAAIRICDAYLRMLRDISGPLFELLTSPVLVVQVAMLTNKLLVTLVEDKSFITSHPTVPHVNQHWISTAIVCFTSFAKSPAFRLEVVRDETNYSPVRFAALVSKLAQFPINRSIIPGFSQAVESLRGTVAFDDTDDAPEDLVDPIMNTLLVDPVELPGSGEWVDRAVITRHLLSDPTNPFNRKPLSIEELEDHNSTPQVAQRAALLKERVAEWKAKRD